MKYIVNGRILTAEGLQTGLALGFENTIRCICPVSQVPANADTFDACGRQVLPGLIDVHIHGWMGDDVTTDGEAAVLRMSERLIANGVTSFLPTTMTVPMDVLERALNGVRAAMQKPQVGAEILGVHAEGPFINPAKKGAQDPNAIQKPDGEWIRRHADVIRYIAMAPEMDPTGRAIAAAVQSGITVAMGHTNATYEEAEAGIQAGARSATHLFNAMPPVNHRAPGLVTAVLNDNRVYAELIGDTFHVDKALFPLVAKLKGDHLVLITDCLSAGGLSAGEYNLGGQKIIAGGPVCYLTDGTIAGSVLRLNKGLLNLVKYSGMSYMDCVACATANPAAMLGLAGKKGALLAGADADILVADDAFEPCAVFTKGVQRM